MDVQYYTEYFSRYADSSEEDAIKVISGAIEMEIVDSIADNLTDKVAHQASIVLNLNRYKDSKDAYIEDICLDACTADCEMQKVVEKCREIINSESQCELEYDIETLGRLLMISSRHIDSKQLGHICEDLMRAYVVHDKPDYSQLSSNIDYILYDLLDVLDLNTSKGREYVYKHRERFIRPVMDLAQSSGDMMLMTQMKQVYNNWMEWEMMGNVS